jgi:hypothetical protein
MQQASKLTEKEFSFSPIINVTSVGICKCMHHRKWVYLEFLMSIYIWPHDCTDQF